ncbi:MAG: sugar phosphate isomerase/epimerase, partial [Acidobacteria bacterium]|nr:sugar phosphate isomerase/epimerase [Acidobacteriota bacterium]
MEPKFRIAAITDEFSPADPALALAQMESIGMTGAELRVLWGKNIMDLSPDELAKAKELAQQHKMEVISIASPILKCVLPGAPEIDTRFQQDIFNSKHTFEGQPRLLERAFLIAKHFDAKIVRVFTYWRTVQPEACFTAICRALADMADQARVEGLIIGVENEHACNVATAADSAKVLDAVQHPNLKLVWDPANALVSGEDPYPGGYSLLPKDRIAHVHVKDCHIDGHKPIWGPVGTRAVDWKGQIGALWNDGYR